MRGLAVVLSLGVLGACSVFPSDPPAAQKFVVYFPEWSASLDDNAQASITAAAGWAQQHQTQTVTVTGFAAPDSGQQQANIDLSRTRGQRVVDQLAKDGVAPSRIRLDAKGPTDFTLAAIESRRVEIAIAGP